MLIEDNTCCAETREKHSISSIQTENMRGPIKTETVFFLFHLGVIGI